ncbi:unnamed protein product [Parajaminaea phylloscopi]
MQLATFTVSVTALAAAGFALAQSTLTVNTPTTLIECQPVQLSWSGGTAPYFPRITEGGNTANTLKTFDTQSGTTLTWRVDIAQGTSVTFTVGDSAGISNSAAQVTVNAGTTSCLGAAASSSAGGTASGSSAAVSSSASSQSSAQSSASSSRSSATSASATSATSGSSSVSRASSSAAAATSSAGSSNGAEAVRGFSAAIAGIVGVAAAALL